jgi:hypothetical protein
MIVQKASSQEGSGNIVGESKILQKLKKKSGLKIAVP